MAYEHTSTLTAFDNIGSLMSEQELDSMLGEIGGPCNYENMVKCFETKMSGFVNDPDDLLVGAFKSYNEECKFIFVFRNNVIFGLPF